MEKKNISLPRLDKKFGEKFTVFDKLPDKEGKRTAAEEPRTKSFKLEDVLISLGAVYSMST